MRVRGVWVLLAACSGDGPHQHADADGDADSDVDAAPDAGCPADAGGDSDSDIDICGCLRDTELRECELLPSVPCDVPEDCCDDASPIPCGYFGNRFTCSAKLCREEGCSSHAECRTWAQSTGLPDADAYGCLDPICGVGTPYCGLGARECETEADCCLVESAVPCGEYGNHWNCSNNRCSMRPCECDADCASGFACVEEQCSDFRFCAPRASCAVDADCCDPGSAIPCGDYGNRFACHGGQCFRAGCQDTEECSAGEECR